MKSFWFRLLVFLLLNFGALALGAIFTNDGVTSDWYQQLHKAPWTPPGFVFGLAWTTIMICFSFFMASITDDLTNKIRVKIYLIYGIQWFLNFLWNPTFFFLHEVFMALLIISLLCMVICYFLYVGIKKSRVCGLLVLPYFVWLLIAISLNCYIWMFNGM